jgi:hypothetical protein
VAEQVVKKNVIESRLRRNWQVRQDFLVAGKNDAYVFFRNPRFREKQQKPPRV